jgi:DNA-binding GntR family transcriptional regulator
MIRVPRGSFDVRDRALALDLRMEIAVVRQILAAGVSYGTSELSQLFEAIPEEIEAAVVPLVSGGLVSREGDLVAVPRLDANDINALIDERIAVDRRIVNLATPDLGTEAREQIRRLVRQAHLASVVGDLEIMVKHDTTIDHIIAMSCPDKGLCLRSRALKSLVRRFWAHTKPFLDVVPMMDMRLNQIDAVAAGDPGMAEALTVKVLEAVRTLLVPPLPAEH